jgi:hypothetical protein
VYSSIGTEYTAGEASLAVQLYWYRTTVPVCVYPSTLKYGTSIPVR